MIPVKFRFEQFLRIVGLFFSAFSLTGVFVFLDLMLSLDLGLPGLGARNWFDEGTLYSIEGARLYICLALAIGYLAGFLLYSGRWGKRPAA